MVAGVERGILVTDFWYTRTLDPKTQVVTGLTRNGVWLIEAGRIVRPVTNLRFTQSFVEALAPGAVRAVSSERALLFGGWDSVYLVPTLHLAEWNFTGGSRG
jgi:predicted Zn-dependent protease